MFAGIVAGTGQVEEVRPLPSGLGLGITGDVLFADGHSQAAGSSVAVNGTCLTVTRLDATRLFFDLSAETLARTTASRWSLGQQVNLEAGLRIGDTLDGHWVTGHVDCLGVIKEKHHEGANMHLRFEVPASLMPLLAPQGSVAVDGVSLTVNQVARCAFTVTMVPWTLEHTIAKHYVVGDQVNLEGDILARYVARLRQFNAREAIQ